MRFIVKKADQEECPPDELEYHTINLPQFTSIEKIKDHLVITILDTVTDTIVDHVFENPIQNQPKADQIEFESYDQVGIFTLVCFMKGPELGDNPTLEDVLNKYDGEVIFVGGDKEYFQYPGPCLPTNRNLRLIVATTY